ncbi:MAG: RIP metalloprotease RseP [Hyphomicrobiales bacterium]
MSFVDGISGLGHWLVTGAPAFLFVLTVVVFFHELGHFLVARWAGVTVEVFSVGFGREIVGFNDRHGTRWRLSMIPLGGYVKFLGDENAASVPDADAIAAMPEDVRRNSLAGKSVGWRSAIVAAGPIANFILAIVVFTMLFAAYGRQYTVPRVDSVVPGSAAETAGFKAGDLILSIDGSPMKAFTDVQAIVTLAADTPLSIVVDRGGVETSLTATPRRQEMVDPFGNKNRVGVLGISRSVSADDIITERYSLPSALVEGTVQTWRVVERSMVFLGRLVSGRESADQLGGPVRIAKTSGDVAEIGFAALVNMIAVISVSIGILNLLPVPMLDGGHLVYYVIEAVRGRPLSEKTQEFGFRVGFALLMMLILFVTGNDILRLVS